jgi:hypothetical protein
MAACAVAGPATQRCCTAVAQGCEAAPRAQAVDPHTIQLRWRLEGRIRLGGISLPIKPYMGTTRYTVDECGLISR